MNSQILSNFGNKDRKSINQQKIENLSFFEGA